MNDRYAKQSSNFPPFRRLECEQLAITLIPSPPGFRKSPLNFLFFQSYPFISVIRPLFMAFSSPLRNVFAYITQIFLVPAFIMQPIKVN